MERTASISKDDLIQEGTIGLMIAVQKYNGDMENAAKFSTYAVFWIKQKIGRFLSQKNTNRETSLNETINGENEADELINFIPDEHDSYGPILDKVYNQQLHEELDRVMNKYCTLQQREVIKLRYGWDKIKAMTIKEIGEVFNITLGRVQHIQRQGLNEIRRSTWGVQRIRENQRKYKAKKYDNVDSLLAGLDYYKEFKKTVERELELYKSKHLI